MEKTPLHEIHREQQAKMIDFGGWEMPVRYSSIIEEHRAVRGKCGLFDISHMGEILISGERATGFLERLVTKNISEMNQGQVRYTPMCNYQGGIIDDLLVYKLAADRYLLVVNAVNTEKDYKWIRDRAEEGVEVSDVSRDYAQLALQGPNSRAVLSGLTELELGDLNYYHFREGEVAGINLLISRTGYTGELGYELYLEPGAAPELWNKLMEAGYEYGIQPAGLGARDTLRLEKKMILYGNDVNEEITPLEAGLEWTVDFDKDFIGSQALKDIKKQGPDRKLVGFKVLGRGIPRHGYKIEHQGETIGEVSSGSYSPTLQENIGLGYVLTEFAETGQQLEILIRKKLVKAEIVDTPFV